MTMTMNMIEQPDPTRVGNGQALVRLMTWLSPSFPVGAYSYSHGLEWAVETGEIGNAVQLTDWVSDLLHHIGADARAASGDHGSGCRLHEGGRGMAGSGER